MTGECLVCRKSSSSKVPNLQRIGFSVCNDVRCLDRFIEEQGAELPVCKLCAYFRQGHCEGVKNNPHMPPLDLTAPRYGLFCSAFSPRGGLLQTKLPTE
jgi:hypothetical protein